MTAFIVEMALLAGLLFTLAAVMIWVVEDLTERLRGRSDRQTPEDQ